MKYVLDTNVVSALIRHEPRIIDRLERMPRSEVAVPQPVLAEIAYGIERLPKSKRKETLRARFELVRAELEPVRWTDEVSDAFGTVKSSLERAGHRIEDFDAAIAAHALAHGAILVTGNLKHMARVPGLVAEDWSA